MSLEFTFRIPRAYYDAGSGHEIIAFRRKNRTYFFIRDYYTKTFKRRLRILYVYLYAVMERCYTERETRGRTRSNNLHVETKIREIVDVSDPNKDYEEIINNAIDDLIERAYDCLEKFIIRAKGRGDIDWDRIEIMLSSEDLGELDCFYSRECVPHEEI
jgi:hypothetical protein